MTATKQTSLVRAKGQVRLEKRLNKSGESCRHALVNGLFTPNVEKSHPQWQMGGSPVFGGGQPSRGVSGRVEQSKTHPQFLRVGNVHELFSRSSGFRRILWSCHLHNCFRRCRSHRYHSHRRSHRYHRRVWTFCRRSHRCQGSRAIP